MNSEEVKGLKSGRKLDSLVAEKVFDVTVDMHWNEFVYDITTKHRYSTNLSTAWEVVERMGDKGWMLYKVAHTMSEGRIVGYTCIFLNIESGASREVSEVSLPKSICKAALLAVMDENQ